MPDVHLHSASGKVAALIGGYKVELAIGAQHDALHAGGSPDHAISDTDWAGWPNYTDVIGWALDSRFAELNGPTRLGHINARLDELHGKVDGLVLGAGTTPDEVKQAVKDALAEGTG